jgi:tRNA dimethylallyltransferase
MDECMNETDSESPTRPRLIVILGPTASGKSELGIALAEKLRGEILVCDSTQVYRHFDIGTAKTPPAEQRSIAHHLVDLVEPGEVFTAGEWARRASEALEDLRRRKALPILTAGTGLYLRALLEGLAEAPSRSEELRDRLRRKVQQAEEAGRSGSEHLHRILTRLDPQTAGRIGPRDTQKVIRAIEMRLLAGKPVDEIFGAGRSGLEGYEVIKIGLAPPRAALYARIDRRVEIMIELGWVGEVRQLVAGGVPPSAKPFQFIGYAQLREHLEGGLSLAAAIAQIQQSTRQFSKRQMTWFRKESNVHWFEGFGSDPAVTAAALALAMRAD